MLMQCVALCTPENSYGGILLYVAIHNKVLKFEMMEGAMQTKIFP